MGKFIIFVFLTLLLQNQNENQNIFFRPRRSTRTAASARRARRPQGEWRSSTPTQSPGTGRSTDQGEFVNAIASSALIQEPYRVSNIFVQQFLPSLMADADNNKKCFCANLDAGGFSFFGGKGHLYGRGCFH